MKQLSHGMFPRFFGGKQLRLCTVLYCTVPLPGPFGDFGYGGRFAGHSPDFFPPGQILYINYDIVISI